MCGSGTGVHTMFNSIHLRRQLIIPSSYHSHTLTTVLYINFRSCRVTLKDLAQQMRGVFNVPQKMGQEWGVRVLDSTQLTWLNDYEGKDKEQKKKSLSNLQIVHP